MAYTKYVAVFALCILGIRPVKPWAVKKYPAQGVSQHKHYGMFLLDIQTQVEALSDSLDRFIEHEFLYSHGDSDGYDDEYRIPEKRKAVCKVFTNPKYTGPHCPVGKIILTQTCGEPLHVDVDISGFVPCKKHEYPPVCGIHGFHVHWYGCVSKDCKDAGGFYNPNGYDIGCHVGDFGNLKSDEHGRIKASFTDATASLFGDDSIPGRSIVIHEKPNPLGKGGYLMLPGSTGALLGCCSIDYVDPGCD